jgi:integrase/recombinase XerD
MNEKISSGNSTDIQEIAAAFDRPLDPLAELESVYCELDVDSFQVFIENELVSDDLNADTIRNYRSVFNEWKEFMANEVRHPACPNEDHVVGFIEWQLMDETDPRPNGRPNAPRTVKAKLRKLNRAYEFWQRHAAFPHPTNYNPFENGRAKVNLDREGQKQHRRIPVAGLREMMASVTHLRSRAIIGLQFKLGLRAGEISNIRLADISLSTSEIQRHYPAMEPNSRPDSIYVPSRDERSGNKSTRPRVLPLDDELRQLLVRYLLVRPDTGDPWLFLSRKTHSKLNKKAVNRIWKEEFHPEYAETDEYRAITSHFGRHRFTTWWRVEQDVNRELVKYMRGDATGTGFGESQEPIDAYIHTYYEDIEELYLEGIYKILP